MDRVVLETKLESLRRCVARIESRRPETAEALARDADAQDIDWLIVHGIAHDRLEDFRAFARAVAAHADLR